MNIVCQYGMKKNNKDVYGSFGMGRAAKGVDYVVVWWDHQWNW